MDRVEELNNRITNRSVPSDMLEPVFDPRPAHTKGGLMPVIHHIKNQHRNFLLIKHIIQRQLF